MKALAYLALLAFLLAAVVCSGAKPVALRYYPSAAILSECDGSSCPVPAEIYSN